MKVDVGFHRVRVRVQCYRTGGAMIRMLIIIAATTILAGCNANQEPAIAHVCPKCGGLVLGPEKELTLDEVWKSVDPTEQGEQ